MPTVARYRAEINILTDYWSSSPLATECAYSPMLLCSWRAMYSVVAWYFRCILEVLYPLSFGSLLRQTKLPSTPPWLQ